MGKLKTADCYYCGQKINRHDVNRVTVQVGKEAKCEAHLSCHQATK